MILTNFNHYFNTPVAAFKQSLNRLTNKQTRILIIVLCALVCLTVCCKRYCFKKVTHIKNPIKNPIEKSEFTQLKENNLLKLATKLEIAKQKGASLTEFDVSDTEITDEQLEEVFKNCPNIRILNLSWCLKLTGSALKLIPKTVRSLNLADLHRLRDDDLTNLPKLLKVLNVSTCVELTDKVVGLIPIGTTELNLSGCYQLTNNISGQLPKHLKILLLSDCELLTDEPVAKNLPELEKLVLDNCYRLKDNALTGLPLTLKELTVSGCVLLTDLFLTQLLHLPNLNILYIFRCDKITRKAIKQLPPQLSMAAIK